MVQICWDLIKIPMNLTRPHWESWDLNRSTRFQPNLLSLVGNGCRSGDPKWSGQVWVGHKLDLWTTISMTSILWLFFIKPRYYLALWVVEIWTNISYSKIKNFINWTNWNLHFILCFYCTTHHSQVHKSITHAHKHTGACTHTHICFFFIYFATTIYVDLSINQLNFG